MSNFFAKTPFAKFLIPALIAIMITSWMAITYIIPLILGVVGLIIITTTLISKSYNQYKHRWVFGAGLFVTIFSIFMYSTIHRKGFSKYDFTDNQSYYLGTIKDLPIDKPKSVALNIAIHHPTRKNIVAYLEKDSNAFNLRPGDEIIFYSKIEPFKNLGNPDDFDYKTYMFNKGFAGSTYIQSTAWMKTKRTSKNIFTHAQIFREKILNIYKSFDLSPDSYSFISALTLGHKDELSNELKEAFRTSGTSHILAVSGMHVGIIYTILYIMFGLFGRGSKTKVLRFSLIIATMWLYAILTGLPPSVVRATIMLTIASIGIATNNKIFIINTLSIAAFIILIFNPLQLFNVGFQMSFGAVLSIVYLNPIISKIKNPKNKLTRYTWNLFTVSLSAQLGLLPITLYYFGTFPTYFFIANVLIVPTLAVVVYLCLAASIFVLLNISWGSIFTTLSSIAIKSLGIAVEFILRIVYFIESLPYSQISNLHISLGQMILLFTIIITTFIFIASRKPNYIIATLAGTLALCLSIMIPNKISNEHYISIFNTPNKNDISIFTRNKRIPLTLKDNGFIPHSHKRILLLSDNLISRPNNNQSFEIDILILTNDKSFSIIQLSTWFRAKQLIIDSTIPKYVKEKWLEECINLGIEVHDVSKDGAFLIKL